MYMYCTVVAHSLGGCGRNDQHLQDTLSNDSPRRGLFLKTWGQERSSEVMHPLGKKRDYKEDHPCHFLVIQNSYDKITNCDG